MKHLYKYIYTLLVGSLLFSCNNFEDINTNPNGSTKSSASLLATGIILDMTGSNTAKPFFSSHLVAKSIAWGENPNGEQYNNFGRSGFGYGIVIDAEKMLDHTVEVNRAGYEGLYYFTKAYTVFHTTIALGDVPYSEAFLGEKGNVKPKYDTQKEVFLQLLADTEKAYAAFDKGVAFDGDFIFKGNSEKWKKATRALQLKILINLSLKENDPELKVKERFQTLIQSSLMTSNADNFQRVYADTEKEYFPIYYTRTNHNDYAMLSSLIVDKLKETQDFRLFYFGHPSDYQVKTLGIDPTSFDAFLGIDPSASFVSISSLYGARKFSNVNKRYTNYAPGEPIVKLGYADQQFILAEAAARGWIAGDADVYYKEGIKAHMQFVADNTPKDVKYNNGNPITPEHITDVQNHPKNQLPSDLDGKIKQIMTQKYLAGFLQREWDAYYDNRRTGYPEFPINPETNQNTDKNALPKRWMYATSEYNFNSENVKEAVQRQWSGTDDVNRVMWILQK